MSQNVNDQDKLPENAQKPCEKSTFWPFWRQKKAVFGEFQREASTFCQEVADMISVTLKSLS